jgi:hypothetical protein
VWSYNPWLGRVDLLDQRVRAGEEPRGTCRSSHAGEHVRNPGEGRREIEPTVVAGDREMLPGQREGLLCLALVGSNYRQCAGRLRLQELWPRLRWAIRQ